MWGISLHSPLATTCLGVYLGLREPLPVPLSQGFLVYRLLVFILLGTELCGSKNWASDVQQRLTCDRHLIGVLLTISWGMLSSPSPLPTSALFSS